jgi:hypothetical protein
LYDHANFIAVIVIASATGDRMRAVIAANDFRKRRCSGTMLAISASSLERSIFDQLHFLVKFSIYRLLCTKASVCSYLFS